MPVNKWEQLIRALPEESPLLRHARCPYPSRCRRPDGKNLGPGTIKLGAYALATYADPDGTNAHPGIGAPRRNDPEHETRGMMRATLRSKTTVIAILQHLERVGLIIRYQTGGEMNVPRHFATIYCLASPPFEQLAAGPDDGGQVYDVFARHQAQ